MTVIRPCSDTWWSLQLKLLKAWTCKMAIVLSKTMVRTLTRQSITFTSTWLAVKSSLGLLMHSKKSQSLPSSLSNHRQRNNSTRTKWASVSWSRPWLRRKSPWLDITACTIGSTSTISSSHLCQILLSSFPSSGTIFSPTHTIQKFWLTTRRHFTTQAWVKCMKNASMMKSSRAIFDGALIRRTSVRITRARPCCLITTKLRTMPTWPLWFSLTSWSTKKSSMLASWAARASRSLRFSKSKDKQPAPNSLLMKLR